MNPETYEEYQAQSELNRQQIDAQTSAFAPQMYEQVQQNQAILVAQTDPHKIIKEIILRLQGFEVLPNGEKRKVSEPMLNIEGIDSIRFLLHSHINDNVRLSYLTRQEISKRIEILGDDLIDSLALNFQKWEIKNKTHLDDINNSVLCNIFDILKRAESGNEKKWLGKISVEQISAGRSGFPSQKSDKWYSKFKL